MPHTVKRPVRIEGDVAYIPLTRGYEAVIDAEDVPLVEGRNWCAFVNARRRTVYAGYRARVEKGRSRNFYLHRLLLNAPEDMQADHIDCDGLNNRRSNLRLASHAENIHNQRGHADSLSGVKGVTWSKVSQKWMAQIRVDGKNRCLGFFADKHEAGAAYAKASAEARGSFGRVS